MESTSMTLTTDASNEGWGAHLGTLVVQGCWGKQHKHINWSEMEAVYLALQHFQNQLQGKHVLIRRDSTSVVQYLNNQGGTKSPTLCMNIWQISKFAIRNSIGIQAAHITGLENCLADNLSRVKIRHREWMLSMSRTVVDHLFNIVGKPMIDLFASGKQLPVANMLHLDTRSENLCDGCSISTVEQHGRVCISAYMSNSKITSAHKEMSMSCSANITTMVKKALIPRNITTAVQNSSQITSARKLLVQPRTQRCSS